MTRSKTIEQKRVLKISCWREEKFLNDSILSACRFGFTEIQPQCQECRWFKISKVQDARGGALITDRELSPEELTQTREQYLLQNQSKEAIPIGEEIG